jgi:hypothetical protein
MQGKAKLQQGETSMRGRSDSQQIQTEEEELIKQRDWAMKICKGKDLVEAKDNDVEDILELDLEEEESVLAVKHMAMAVFYSQKSYNPKFLFSDMLNAWSIKELAGVEKLEDYCFKIGFTSAKEKIKVFEGGPWRHKGDAHITVHYDGLIRPSEVKIDALQMWIRLYDLPAAMMTKVCGK